MAAGKLLTSVPLVRSRELDRACAQLDPGPMDTETGALRRSGKDSARPSDPGTLCHRGHRTSLVRVRLAELPMVRQRVRLSHLGFARNAHRPLDNGMARNTDNLWCVAYRQDGRY